LVGLALIGTACTGAGKQTSTGEIDEDAIPVGAQTYTVDVDVPSPEGQKLQASVFLPVSLSVMPGDTVVFENRSTEAPHTVTFLPKDAPPPEPYPLVTKTGTANPLLFAPCYTATAPAAGAEACPEAPAAVPPVYAGTGFWSSGALAPTTAAGAPHSVSLTVAPNIEPGSYNYTCALHPKMSGVLDVVASADLRRSTAATAKKAQRQRRAVLAGAAQLAEPAVNGAVVNAGWGDATFAVNKFSPAEVRAKAGQTVTWKATSFEPHTVTFESPFLTPDDPGVLTPGGTKAGARYSGGFAHSGLVGPQPRFAGATFSLLFAKPGTYSYVCVLHPGMAGQVVVTD